MGAVHIDSCAVLAGSLPPAGWIADLAGRLAADLDAPSRELPAAHEVDLGHGIRLAHLRSSAIPRPRVAAIRLSGASAGTDWLLIAALLPEGDAARHLGWLAHLAAGLHDPLARGALARASDGRALAQALARLVAEPADAGRAVSVIGMPEPPPMPARGGWRLAVAIFKDHESVDSLLTAFVEHGIGGATILDGRGMAEHLAAHVSLFAGFKTAFKGVGHSQVVLALIPAERESEVLEMIQGAGDGLDAAGSGIGFCLDVTAAVGLAKPA